jgi:sugar/nucleoside kinase (ribokinase family)
MNQYDFIAIGDITTDAFIRIKDASVTCDINHENCLICMRFGDKIPFESVEIVKAVGNSANAAVAAARLGISSALISNIGNDQNGAECVEELKKNNVGTDFVATHEGKATNYHYVLWYEDERTILIKHEKFDYTLPDIGKPKWIYLTSMGETSLSFHQTLAEYLAQNPEVKLAFQPGTFQMKLGVEALKGIYEHTEVFFCNKEEARRILQKEHDEIPELLNGLKTLGPKIVIISDGPHGAHALVDGVTWQMPMYPDPKPPFERTGAGDAFASTIISALLLGKSPEEALRWGPVNSMSVVQQVGAQKGLLSREKLEEYLANAPADYTPKRLN